MTSSNDVSPSSTATLEDVATTVRVPKGKCGMCPAFLYDVRARFCSRKCRQAAFRLRGRRGDMSAPAAATVPRKRFAYADPPYPGLAKKYYGDQPTYKGEVDHVELIQGLERRRIAGELAGWALSTAGRSLRELLPLCPPDTHVAVWVKDLEVPPATHGPHYRWEAVLVAGGRRMQPGVIDWLKAPMDDVLEARPARLGGETLPGRKPLAFCAWLFDLLGMVPGDELEDLFPGTGVVSRAWHNDAPNRAERRRAEKAKRKKKADPDEPEGGWPMGKCGHDQGWHAQNPLNGEIICGGSTWTSKSTGTLCSCAAACWVDDPSPLEVCEDPEAYAVAAGLWEAA